MNHVRVLLNFIWFINYLTISGIKITDRHSILYHSIGYLPEEHQAYGKVWMLISISVICVIVGTIVELFAFISYNENLHPFSNIIDGKKFVRSKFGYFTPRWGLHPQIQGEEAAAGSVRIQFGRIFLKWKSNEWNRNLNRKMKM